MERFNLSEKDAEQTIWKDDKRRADNYHYYTNRMLGAAGNFDISQKLQSPYASHQQSLWHFPSKPMVSSQIVVNVKPV